MSSVSDFKEEIDELLSKMTLKEKVGQLNQRLYGWEIYKKTKTGYELTDTFKEEVKRWGGIGAIYGIFRADPWSKVDFENGIDKEDSLKVINMIQEYIKENTRMKIPAIFSEESPHGHQSLDGEMFPCNIAIGSTWNLDLIKEVSECISDELSEKGANLALVSTLDLLRDPRWGRSEECFSEDPYLCAKYTEAIVDGYQKNNFENNVGVVLKHLCAQGAAVGGHNSGAANIGERELREIFLPPVESGARRGAIGFMAAYNEIDGIPCHVNKKLLNDILRHEYQFNGIVMADGCALDRLTIMTRNKEKAGKLAIEAGVDISLWDDIYTNLHKAVENKIIDELYIDNAVRRVLYVKFKLGLFDKKKRNKKSYIDPSIINKKAASESIVLLKNNGVLPLSKEKKKIAVVGPNADTPYNQLGDYTSPQRKNAVSTVLDGIKKFESNNITVNYSKGCSIRDISRSGFEEAINLAKNSDYTIVAIGGSSARDFDLKFENNGAALIDDTKKDVNCGENVDLANLDLDGLQVELVRELSETGTKVIVVLIQGRPHSIGNILDFSDAVLCAWYPGKMGGEAIAETIFGINNPNGKLAVSIPVSSMQLPCYYNAKDSGAKIDYLDMSGLSLFPFGFGLSYTNFVYDKLRVDNEVTIEDLLKGKEVSIHVNIKNCGDFDGYEVAQLYIRDEESSITRRVKELKGFKKVFIKSGEEVDVEFKLGFKELSIWDYNLENRVEPGEVSIMVGKNSIDYIEKKLLLI